MRSSGSISSDLAAGHASIPLVLSGFSLPERNGKALIEDASHRKVVSIANCWEIAIKTGLGKLRLGESSASYLSNALARTGIEVLPISLAHATGVERLAPHHKDPFDRLLIAQAQSDGMALVSSDAHFDRYGVQRLW